MKPTRKGMTPRQQPVRGRAASPVKSNPCQGRRASAGSGAVSLLLAIGAGFYFTRTKSGTQQTAAPAGSSSPKTAPATKSESEKAPPSDSGADAAAEEERKYNLELAEARAKLDRKWAEEQASKPAEPKPSAPTSSDAGAPQKIPGRPASLTGILAFEYDMYSRKWERDPIDHLWRLEGMSQARRVADGNSTMSLSRIRPQTWWRQLRGTRGKFVAPLSPMLPAFGSMRRRKSRKWPMSCSGCMG